MIPNLFNLVYSKKSYSLMNASGDETAAMKRPLPVGETQLIDPTVFWRMFCKISKKFENLFLKKLFILPFLSHMLRPHHELAISLSGCGFLCSYHIGAMICFQKHAKSLLSRVNFYCGASAGALIASLLVLAPQSLETSLSQLYKLAEEVQNQRPFGALTPGFNMAQRLAKIVDNFLPENIDQANGRLVISVTRQRDWSNRLISVYPTRDYLMQCLNATCYIPLYSSSTPPTIDGERYIDGVYSNNLPIPEIPNVHTISVSPFSGGATIAPRDEGTFDWQMIMGQQRINVNIKNVMRGAQSLFPQSLERLDGLYHGGYYDAMFYLLRKGCFEREIGSEV